MNGSIDYELNADEESSEYDERRMELRAAFWR